MNKSHFYFVSCPRGLEGVLYQESLDYTFEKRIKAPGGIKICSDFVPLLTFMMQSRVASRFYREVGQIHFSHEKNLLKNAKEIPWHKIMDVKQTFKINCLLSKEVRADFRNSHYLSLVLKDSIVDTFQEKQNKRPSINLDNPHYSFLLRIDKGHKKKYLGTVLVDMSGQPLHRRGYRDVKHDAPMKENLAAGLVLLSDWDRKVPFYDPFCGSGTILLEAALIKYNIAPTFMRLQSFLDGEDEFDMVHQGWFKATPDAGKILKNLAHELVTYARKAADKMEPDEFFGGDIIPKSLRLTSLAWKQAGFTQTTLSLEKVDACDSRPYGKEGIIITNPPFGERLENENDEELEKLYYEFGENLKSNYQGFCAYIIMSDPNLRKKISLRTAKRTTVYNGGIECRLIKYELY